MWSEDSLSYDDYTAFYVPFCLGCLFYLVYYEIFNQKKHLFGLILPDMLSEFLTFAYRCLSVCVICFVLL